MKKQLLFLLLLLAACGQKEDTKKNNTTEDKTVTPTDSSENYSTSIVTEDDFLNAKNNFKDPTLYDTASFRKNNGKIELPLQDKKQRFAVFKDTLVDAASEDVRQYVYVGQFDKLGLYIVGGSFWEHFECYLINKKTGQQTTIWNDPMPSSDNKYMASLSLRYGLEGIPNGLQLWKVINEAGKGYSLQKYFEIDQQIWIPEDFAWETNETLVLKVFAVQKYWNEAERHPEDYYYLRIRIK